MCITEPICRYTLTTTELDRLDKRVDPILLQTLGSSRTLADETCSEARRTAVDRDNTISILEDDVMNIVNYIIGMVAIHGCGIYGTLLGSLYHLGNSLYQFFAFGRCEFREFVGRACKDLRLKTARSVQDEVYVCNHLANMLETSLDVFERGTNGAVNSQLE